jgi:CRISPR-associated protein Cmr2
MGGLRMSNAHSYDLYNHFSGLSKTTDILDYYSKIQLYSLNKKQKLEEKLEAYKDVINNSNSSLKNAIQLLNEFGLYQPTVNINHLPENSFFVQFEFTLKRPFYSKDDEQFYIIDNSISKESVFKVPMVRPSGWAGALRNAIVNNDKEKQNELESQSIDRLFGYTSDKEDDNKKGFLTLFPTYFDDIKFEIINPHDRETKAGKNPIYYEVVPAKSTGLLSLLYVPFYVSDEKKEHVNDKIAIDIYLVAKGLKSMFLTYGFGAKTSSGFGIAENDLIEGKITLKSKCVTAPVHEDIKPPEKAFLKYLNEDGALKDFFKDAEGKLITKITGEKLSQIGGGSLNEFKSFKKWYNKEDGHKWQKRLQSKNETSVKWPSWPFNSFDELTDIAKDISQNLQNFKEEGQ